MGRQHLKKMVKRDLGKANDNSQYRHLANFFADLLEDPDNDAALLEACVDEFVVCALAYGKELRK